MSEGSRYHILPQFIPPGPVAAKWIDDNTTPICFIEGPAGSGKTTGAVFKGPRWCARHMPVCADGRVRAKLTVLRDNYRRLAETALKSWKLVFKEDFPFSEYSGGQDRPVHHRLEFEIMRGGAVAGVKPGGEDLARRLAERFPKERRIFELEVEFMAVGDHAIEEMLRGYETSMGWCNEADLLQERVPGFLFGRTGRYPSKLMLPDELVELFERGLWDVPRQVYGDLNPPDVDHWTEKWDKEKRDGFKLYRQPSGLSPAAENRKGKSYSEYVADLKVMDEYDAMRFVHGKPAYARDGVPVYAVPKDNIGGFRQEVHVAPGPIAPVRELPINWGFDAGGTPAGALIQPMPSGQVRILREVTTEPITGAARFGEMVLAIQMRDFKGVPVGNCYGDPAAFFGADKIVGELAWMQTVALAIGHNIEPAPSQEPELRIGAVALLLKQHGMLLIDPSCTMIIAGFAAHYKLGKDTKGKIINGGRPIKNEYSHVHEALQYVCLGTKGRAGVIQDSARAGRPGNVVPIVSGHRASADFDVYSV